MDISISSIKKRALTALKGQWGLAVLLTLIFFLITSVVPSIVESVFSGGFTNWINDDVPPSASILSMIVSLAIAPISISFSWFFLDLTRMQGPKIEDVFAVFSDGKRYLKLIGASILFGIYIFLWSLLLIIPGIIKSISYSQAFFILKDHPEYSISEAITLSRKRMNGYKGKYFLMNLSFIGWGILSIFTLGIGFLWLTPYIYTSIATFYNELIYTQDPSFTEDPILE